MRTLGPAVCGTVVCADVETSIEAYALLGLRIVERSNISEELAAFWYAPATAGLKSALLASESDAAWLRLIEDPLAADGFNPFKTHGWLALEVSVIDVDALAETIRGSAFKIIGEPANLEVSDALRAMQVQGPSGEILYLTEVKAEVPPFELPRASVQVDNLFIPVMITPSREASAEVFQLFDGLEAYSFDTKVTVINRAYGYPIQRQHPVIALQLADNSLIEIDQVDEAVPRQQLDGHLPGGIAMVTFYASDEQAIPATDASDFGRSIYARRKAAYRTGMAGEGIEILVAE